MRALLAFLSRCLTTLYESKMEADLQQELEFHLQMETDRLTQTGLSPEDARRAARKRFGGVAQTKEAYRTAAALPWLETIAQDLRYAARSLKRQPGFTAIAVLTLAIGIGANTAIYTVVDATMLRRLPYRDPDRLMRISLVAPAGNGYPEDDDAVWSYPKYEAFRRMQHSFAELALYRTEEFGLTHTDRPEHLLAEMVSASYFPLLGVRAELGRTFLPEEDRVVGKASVVVLSHAMWLNHYGADPAIVGKTIVLDRTKYTVVGVLSPDFRGLGGPADVWLPVHADYPQLLSQPFLHAFQQVARLKPGIRAEQAKSEVATLGPDIDAGLGRPAFEKPWGAKAATLNEARLDRTIRKSVLVLFAAVTFVLLMACVNLANLLLARGSTRRREIAVRFAVGATKSRVVRHLLTESMLLAILGAGAGLVLAYAGVFALNLINPANGRIFALDRIPGLTALGFSSIHLDARALLFTVGSALLAGLLFGLAPAFEGTRTEVNYGLKNTAFAPQGLPLFSGKSLLVVTEVALAMILLAAAGLMIRSFAHLIATRTGINPENVLTVPINPPLAAKGDRSGGTFFEDLQQRLAALPEVVSAGVSDCHALAGRCSETGITFPDKPPVREDAHPVVPTHWASPGYFTTMQIPLLRGRWFTASDRGKPKVLVISETAARRFWPGEDPIGKPAVLGISGFDRGTVIGVVGDVRYGQLDEPFRPDVYVSPSQIPWGRMFLFVRTKSNPLTLIDAVRREVHALNKDIPLYDIKTMNERISDAGARARFSAVLLAVFAVIAVGLAGVGIYGVMSYMVRQRTREIGIRMAFGARPEDVRAMVVRRTAAMTAAGIAIGLDGAFGATRVLASLLYEVKPSDPITYAAVSTLLAGLALLAGYLPARRASKIDPCAALRAE